MDEPELEPAHSMAQMTIAGGITVINAKAEGRPFHGLPFDCAIIITTVCFLENIARTFAEARRIVKKNVLFIESRIDKCSELGKKYEMKKA